MSNDAAPASPAEPIRHLVVRSDALAHLAFYPIALQEYLKHKPDDQPPLPTPTEIEVRELRDELGTLWAIVREIIPPGVSDEKWGRRLEEYQSVYREAYLLQRTAGLTEATYHEWYDRLLRCNAELIRQANRIDAVGPRVQQPDGPFDPNGFRWRKKDVLFGKAALPRELVYHLWKIGGGRLPASSKVGDVISAVWGKDRDSKSYEARLTTLLAGVRDRLLTIGLTVRTEAGTVVMEQRPG